MNFLGGKNFEKPAEDMEQIENNSENVDSVRDTAFFSNGSSKQFEYCLKLYPQVLKIKAESKSKKPEELIKLDDWFQNELPKKLKQQGKDAHLVYDELVQCMKWKQSRGKFYPQLSNLIKINTPRAVLNETKRAFKRLPNLEQSLAALSCLKGVGTTMASALLSVAAPELAPFMADECLLSIPDMENIDYTTKEYLKFVELIQGLVNRLNSEKNCSEEWTPHRVELALWTHYVASELSPELLKDMPQFTEIDTENHKTGGTNGVTAEKKISMEEPIDNENNESNLEPAESVVSENGVTENKDLDDSTLDSMENSMDVAANEDTNDSQSSAKRSLDSESQSLEELAESSEPELKKLKDSD